MTPTISATCPQCGGTEMNMIIGVTNPAMAVAAEALPHGVIMRCSNQSCYHFSADFSDIACPKCGKKKLETSVDKATRLSPEDVINGVLKCTACGWSLKVSTSDEPPMDEALLDEIGDELEKMEEELDKMEDELEKL